YVMSSADFDLAFMTPVQIYAAQYQSERASRRELGADRRSPGIDGPFTRPVVDFANWAEYFMDFPSVLVVRATPKFVEGVWTKVARGAAQTQGVSIPPIKHFKSDFGRMRAYCGE